MFQLTIIKIVIFCLGAIVGSFLNVCIWRLPRRESIIRPGSHCPHCKQLINWYDNIPFASHLLLKGKCRHCGAKISLRYFVVELLTASLMLFLFNNFGLSLHFWIYSLLISGLIAASFIDLATQEIPDEISLSGIAVGLVFSAIFPQLQDAALHKIAFLRSLLGILAGGGSIYITGLIGNLIFRKETMGGGDVKLMAMAGAFIGWKLALLTFFLAPFFGSVVGIILKLKEGKSLIPYGPFLSLAALISIIWGTKIINWLV